MFGIESLRHHLDCRIDEIIERVDNLERIVTAIANTIQDLDQALTDFEAAQDAANSDVNAAVKDILSKVGPTVDVSAEVARIKAAQQKQQDAANAIKGLDVQPSP